MCYPELANSYDTGRDDALGRAQWNEPQQRVIAEGARGDAIVSLLVR